MVGLVSVGVSPGLAWQDHAVIILYLAGMVGLGAALSRRQESEEEYFLGGRRMPWFAVGVSVIASLLSSLTYLSEPGEVWRSGATHMVGKMLAIPLEMLFVFLVCLPFLMRFRYTSAYEYLGERFGPGTRRLGGALFLLLVVLWMGFIVLASSRALSAVSGMPLGVVISTVGIVATVYTIMGGLRAVIWTDVVQVGLLIGGGVFTIAYVAVVTDSGLTDWYAVAREHLAATGHDEPLPLFSLDPTVRATILTVALNMFIWHVCTHTANQMTVQRYFSTSDVSAARRSFITGSLVGVGLNLMLMVVGMALVYYFVDGGRAAELALDLGSKQGQDLVFPKFAIQQLPPGLGGAILAALLAAAMSSIDSGINSMATVVSAELDTGERSESAPSHDHVTRGRWMTLVFGLFITAAAWALDFLPSDMGIVDAMPRTFNAVTAPLGGLFFIGMFLPRATGRIAVIAVLCGLATSITLGYWHILGNLLHEHGIVPLGAEELSFTWVMPGSLLVTMLVGAVLCAVMGSRTKADARLTVAEAHG